MLRLVGAIDRVSGGVGMAGAVLVVPLGIVMVYEVVLRFAFNLPTFWAYELSWMLTGAHFALGIALVTRRQEHIRVDFIYAIMPPRVRAGLDLAVTALLVLPMVGWIGFSLAAYAHRSYVLGEVSVQSGWDPLVWPVRTVVAAGFLFFALQLVAEIVKSGRAAFGHATPPPET